MDMQWNKIDVEDINKLNGQCVVDALTRRRYGISKLELLKCFNANDSKALHGSVQSELNRILVVGVENGFIVERCGKYALPNLECAYVNDGDPPDGDCGDSDESVEEVRKSPIRTKSGRTSKPTERFTASSGRPYMHPSTGATVKGSSAVAAPPPATITSGSTCSSPSVSVIFKPSCFSTPVASTTSACSTPSIALFNPTCASTPMASITFEFNPGCSSTPMGPATSSTATCGMPSTPRSSRDSASGSGSTKRKLPVIEEEPVESSDEECPTTRRSGRDSKKPKRYPEE
ncbi:hypothetical protein HA402_014441 [Bradysia odoriphaga]|nr:hypothetical protein HA402_014441 [Bradysia odoriphaga]